jgi:hypothetical protein
MVKTFSLIKDRNDAFGMRYTIPSKSYIIHT